MTCREFLDFLLDYMANDLDNSQKEKFEQHIAVCPDCLGS